MRKGVIQKLKQDCPECCNFNLVISPENCLAVKGIQAEHLARGKKISFENAVNKIITEYREGKK